MTEVFLLIYYTYNIPLTTTNNFITISRNSTNISYAYCREEMFIFCSLFVHYLLLQRLIISAILFSKIPKSHYKPPYSRS